MEKMSVLMLLITLTVCWFCGKDFQSLGRHSWRCKSKIEGSNDANPINNGFNNIKHYQLKYVKPENNAAIVCCCGRQCKGKRGLRIHQRTCKTIEGLAKTVNKEILNELSSEGNLEDHEVDVI